MKKYYILIFILINCFIVGTVFSQETGQSQVNPVKLIKHFGITGSMTAGDFLIKNIIPGSLAEKSGLKKGDIITAISSQPLKNVDYLAGGLQDFEFSNNSTPIDILRNNKSMEIGWPPVVETLLTDTQMQQITLYKNLADKSLSESDVQASINDFNTLLICSINYPYRGDIYFDLAEKIYLPEILYYWEKPFPDFSVLYANRKRDLLKKKVFINADIPIILRARAILQKEQTAYLLGEKYYDMAVESLQNAGIELKRAGSKSIHKNLKNDIDKLNSKLIKINTDYGMQRLSEFQDFNNKLSKIDPANWIICNGTVYFKRNGNRKKGFFYFPEANIMLKNTSSDKSINIKAQVMFVDESGTSEATSNISIFCPAGSVQFFHVNNNTRLPAYIVKNRLNVYLFADGLYLLGR